MNTITIEDITVDKQRDEKTMQGVERDVAELRKATETDLLKMVLYEAVDPDKKDPTERLVHTVKWQAAQQIILNEKLRKLTLFAWIIGLSTVIAMIFQVISVFK